MTHTDDTERKAFEAWISAPPFEQSVRRYGKDPQTAAWPGNYREYNVQLAWCAWEARAALAAPSVPSGEPQPVAWHVVNPAGNVVATEKDAVHGWARLGGFKLTVEGLLGLHDEGWRVFPASATPQPAPAGWRLVPVEPTIEMQWAGAVGLDSASHSDLDPTLEEITGCYRAMLDAAPAAPGGEG
jgi:hypothetical protein